MKKQSNMIIRMEKEPTLAALGLAALGLAVLGFTALGLAAFEAPSPAFVTALSTLASLKLWAPFLPAGAADTSAPAAFRALTALRILAGALAASTGNFPITNFLTVTSEEPVLDLVSATAWDRGLEGRQEASHK